MRILKALLVSLVTLLVSLVVLVYVTREVLVLGSVWLVRNRYTQFASAVQTGEYNAECGRLGVLSGEQLPRLRFISSTEYLTEVVCGGLEESAVVGNKYKLWPLVKKGLGDSGLSGLPVEKTVVLDVFGRLAAVKQSDDGETELVWKQKPISVSANGPTAHCAAYGATCCIEGEEQGIGDQVRGSLDCPKNCFVRCHNRPVILAFNSSPFYDYETRVLTVKRNQEVEFSYVISETQKDFFADARLKEQSDPIVIILSLVRQLFERKPDSQKEELTAVVVDFGDGETATSAQEKGTVSHTYQCAREICRFTAALSAKNKYGAQTQVGYLSTITINVVP